MSQIITSTFQEDGSIVVPDCHIDSSNPTTNVHSALNFTIGFFSGKTNPVYRLVIQFPLSGIPVGAKVASVDLVLECLSGAASAEPCYVGECSRNNWVELEVTWNQYSSHTGWTTPGGDFTVSFSFTTFNLPTAPGTLTISDSSTFLGDLAERVQNAIDTGATTLNLILFRQVESGTSAAAVFYTSENATVSNRPKLVVNWYKPVPIGQPSLTPFMRI